MTKVNCPQCNKDVEPKDMIIPIPPDSDLAICNKCLHGMFKEEDETGVLA